MKDILKAKFSDPELKEKLASHNVALENYLLTFVYQRLFSMDNRQFYKPKG